MKLKAALKTMALNPEHDFPLAYCHQKGTETVKLQKEVQVQEIQKDKTEQFAERKSRSGILRYDLRQHCPRIAKSRNACISRVSKLLQM